MRILLYSRYGQYPKNLEQLVRDLGLENVKDNPEVVITYGGDGTLLGAERDFPNVPKLPIKDSGVGFHTIALPPKQTLELFIQKKLHLKEYFKITATIGKTEMAALNEIAIRNKLINSAVRFDVSVHNPNGGPVNFQGLIGDGLIVATPFGSTGYFYSIAHQAFTSAIGIAFNNTHNQEMKPLVLADSSKIEIKILRGPAELSSDNDPQIIDLDDSSSITIQKSPHTAKIYSL